MDLLHHSARGLASAFLGCLLATPVLADNGKVAHSRPIDSLTIDGRSDDWPSDARAYPINEAWQDDQDVAPGDFSATFRSGYNATKGEIYLLVEVQDERQVGNRQSSEGQQAPWQYHDACILYIDTQHSIKGSGSQIYLAFGNQRKTLGKDDAWDAATGDASWNNIELAVERVGHRTTYEWKIKNCRNVEAGMTIGLDLLLCDADQDDNSAGSVHFWGPGDGKSQGAGRLGDLMLVASETELFNVSGRLAWKKPGPSAEYARDVADGAQALDPPFPDRVQLFSKTTRVATVTVDEAGEFGARLPEGEYRVSLASAIAEGATGQDDRRAFVVGNPVISAGDMSDGETATLPLDFQPVPHFHSATSPLFDYSPQHDEDLIRVLESYREYYGVPGYSMALVSDGKLAFSHAAGQSNRFTGKAVDKETLFEAASITKAVFAFAVNRLAERGEIDLDKPLHEYLEFAELAHDPRARLMTARHCLNHSSGLPNWFGGRTVEDTQMLFSPGEKHGYSGEAMQYLGRVVTHIQNKPLEQVVFDEACRPCGFTSSVFFSDSMALRSVASFGHVNGMPQAHDNQPQILVAASMFTEAKAFSKFMISLMKRSGLKAETYDEMFALSMPDDSGEDQDPPRGFGLGFHIEESEDGRVIQHGGNNGDFQCLFEIHDREGDGFVIFTNADTGGDFIVAVRDYLKTGEAGDDETHEAPRPAAQDLTLEEFEARLVEIEQQAVLPGFAVSIFDKDQVIYEAGFGYADIETKRRFDSNSVQCIASISKTVVATAMMQAVEGDALGLDDPVNQHLPFEVIHPKFRDTPITLRHLATHTASICDGDQFDKTYYFRGELLESDFQEAWHEHLRAYNSNEHLGLVEYLGRALSTEGDWNNGSSFLPHEPGTAYDYSNSGIGLLGLAVQGATETDLRELTRKQIFEPIGMESTTWRLEEVDPKQHVTYYNEWLDPVPPYTFSTYPDGGVFSSVSDMRRFAQEMMRARLGESTVLSQSSAIEMMGDSGLELELPVALVWDTEMGELIGHAGNDFGTATYMYFDPNTGIGRILFTNVSTETASLSSAVKGIYNMTFQVTGSQ